MRFGEQLGQFGRILRGVLALGDAALAIFFGRVPAIVAEVALRLLEILARLLPRRRFFGTRDICQPLGTEGDAAGGFVDHEKSTVKSALTQRSFGEKKT